MRLVSLITPWRTFLKNCSMVRPLLFMLLEHVGYVRAVVAADVRAVCRSGSKAMNDPVGASIWQTVTHGAKLRLKGLLRQASRMTMFMLFPASSIFASTFPASMASYCTSDCLEQTFQRAEIVDSVDLQPMS